ncbi:MAG: ATP-binding protein [Chthoniobacterales bacterium]|nr:ATP-binding protein [Chthoniobacterales bacterium]
MSPEIYEKLGQFYLGRQVETDGKPTDDLVLYDSSSLTTHGVCVGMTGSGKTGLCLALLEEAAMDGIPALIVDPKGDLGNLLLTFPQMRGEDFAPWVNEEDARKAGVSSEEFAAAEAEKWKNGLAEWGQSPERIAALRQKADIAIYTPGSNAGIPLSILRSFEAPDHAVAEDAELLSERVQSTTAGLLGLLGLNADPLKSREFSLLSAILQDAWKKGSSPDLAGLIGAVQNPPFASIGVLPLDDFYPPKQRMELVMALNNLLASPGFATWREGEPLDIANLLHTPEGKPRLAVLSIAHLSDAERMFFITTLLEEVIAWMRRQPGTPSLRALLYIDEIFGYLPPVANPPSKGPLLLLLKQARAFGLGILVATQNPADLDYKALANCGTWFIGRLQTDRDKQRVLEGLESASAGRGAGRAKLNEMLNSLGKRVFLLNSVHLPAPVMFQTRWTMSYLRGPLTRDQIRLLMDSARPAKAATAMTAAPVASSPTAATGATPEPPAAEAGVWQRVAAETASTLIPTLGLRARGTFACKRPVAETAADFMVSVPFGPDGKPAWKNAVVAGSVDDTAPPVPHGGSLFAPAAASLLQASSHGAWQLEGRQQLGENLELSVRRTGSVTGAPFEDDADFRLRIEQGMREQRDEAVRRLREKFSVKSKAAAQKVERAREAVARQQSQARAAQMQTAISFGTSILGAFLGKKTMSLGNMSRASTAARGATRAMKESTDVGTAQERLTTAEAEAAEFEAELEAQIAAIPSPADAALQTAETVRLKLVPSTLRIESAGILWTA